VWCLQGGAEVSVVAGSAGTDRGGRVAYVKTVHQSPEAPAESNAAAWAAPAYSDHNGTQENDRQAASAPVKHLLVSADINAASDQVCCIIKSSFFLHFLLF